MYIIPASLGEWGRPDSDDTVWVDGMDVAPDSYTCALTWLALRKNGSLGGWIPGDSVYLGDSGDLYTRGSSGGGVTECVRWHGYGDLLCNQARPMVDRRNDGGSFLCARNYFATWITNAGAIAHGRRGSAVCDEIWGGGGR